MTYYRGTNLYDVLADRAPDRFVWVAGDAWCLIYGDAAAAPRLAVFVEAVPVASLSDTVTQARVKVRSAFFALADGAHLPKMHIRFPTDRDLEAVVEGTGTGVANELSLEDLRGRFEAAGVPVRSGAVTKAINRQSSSSFHEWQRATLGSEITVSDVDLLRVDPEDRVAEVVEIKRSNIPLAQWSPFRDDYDNFRLVGGLADANRVPFTISYHLYAGLPRVDDPSRLSLWRVETGAEPPVVSIGVFELQAFLDSRHLAS